MASADPRDPEYGAPYTGSADVQTITLTGATGGTFTLANNTGDPTSDIAYNANAATVQTAVRTLTGRSAVTVVGTGPWVVTAAANGGMDLLVIDGSSLTGSDVVAAVAEKQTITLDTASAGSFTLALATGDPTADIAFNATTAVVQTAVRTLDGLSAATVSGTAGSSYVVTLPTAAGALAELTVDDTNLTAVSITVAITTEFAAEVPAGDASASVVHTTVGSPTLASTSRVSSGKTVLDMYALKMVTIATTDSDDHYAPNGAMYHE